MKIRSSSQSRKNGFPLRSIESDEEYYSLTFGADEDGKIWIGGQTSWAGYDEENNRIELRKLRLVDGKKMAALLKSLGEPFSVVNNSADFAKLFIGGGHALIKPQILKKHMPWELEPQRCVREGMTGFTAVEDLPKTVFNRAPTPKLRMAVMKRDNYRCVLCGRRSTDHVDVEIHVHHIRPFGQRGLTTKPNLVTLCHTCHKGLDPHYNWDLYGFVDGFVTKSLQPDVHQKHRDDYFNAVQHYRRAIASDLRAFKTKKA